MHRFDRTVGLQIFNWRHEVVRTYACMNADLRISQRVAMEEGKDRNADTSGTGVRTTA